MQEVLAKIVQPNAPLNGQEFYKPRLDDSDDIWKGRHVIREVHARWDESVGSIVWDEADVEHVRPLEPATERCEPRRAALSARGFIYSDMEW